MVKELHADELLALCDVGHGRGSLDRALLLLNWASDGYSWQDLLALPLGRRDVLLMRLKQELFGPTIKLSCTCGRCGADYQLDTSIPELLSVCGKSEDNVVNETRQLVVGEDSLRYRLPNSKDLAALRSTNDPEAAARNLAFLCLEGARKGKTGRYRPVTEDQVSPEWVAALSDAFDQDDPAAVLVFPMDCNDCGHSWRAVVDAVQLVWAEVEEAARAVLDEVHILTKAYGWTERDILAIPRHRRRAYLRILQGEG